MEKKHFLPELRLCFFPAHVSARRLRSRQQLVRGVSFHVDFHQPRDTHDWQPSPAHLPEMQLLLLRPNRVIMTCRFRVTDVLQNACAACISSSRSLYPSGIREGSV